MRVPPLIRELLGLPAQPTPYEDERNVVRERLRRQAEALATLHAGVDGTRPAKKRPPK